MRLRNLPDFLDPDAVFLRLLARGEVELGDDLLGERAARSLGDEDVAAAQFQPRLVIGLGLAVPPDAKDPGDNAGDPSILAPDHLGSRHARIDLDPERLGLARQPAAEISERADVAAMIVHEAGHWPGGNRRVALRPERQEAVAGDGRIERRALFLPLGDEFVERPRIDDGARKDVGPDLRSFLDHGDRDFRLARGGELLQADGGGQTGGPGADHHHVIIHGLARGGVAHAPVTFSSGRKGRASLAAADYSAPAAPPAPLCCAIRAARRSDQA